MNAGTGALTPCGAASGTDTGAIQGVNVNTTAVSRGSPHNGIPCVESARTATVASREGVTVRCLCLEEGAADWKGLEVLATLSPVVVPQRICAAVSVRSPLHPGVVLSVADN